MENSNARKLKLDAQQELRKQTISLLKADMKQKQIDEILGVYPALLGK